MPSSYWAHAPYWSVKTFRNGRFLQSGKLPPSLKRKSAGQRAAFKNCVTPVSSHRGIIEESRFTTDFDHFRAKYAHMDEVHEWLTWTLTENPRAGEVDERAPDYRYLKTPARGD